MVNTIQEQQEQAVTLEWKQNQTFWGYVKSKSLTLLSMRRVGQKSDGRTSYDTEENKVYIYRQIYLLLFILINLFWFSLMVCIFCLYC